MQKFMPCVIYDLESNFIGYVIKKSDTPKLQSTNLYVEGEEASLNEQLARLNQDLDLKAFWPHPQDPDVVKLLADETFMPIEYVTAEVVDDDNSYYVYQKVSEVDAYGSPTGQIIDGEDLDQDASVIVYKEARVPKRPTDVMWRIKSACEAIAKQRVGLR